MQWPNMNFAGVMICGFMLESEMFSHGPAQHEAEPVSVAAKSEMFTPVFAGGGVVAEASPLVVAEAVTSQFLLCRRSEVISRPVCLRLLAGKTGCV